MTQPFTKLYPNLYDFIMTANLSAVDIKCLLLINRKTVGYGKISDRISYSQFQKATDSSRSSVFNSLKKLADLGIISIKKDVQKCSYSIQTVSADCTGSTKTVSVDRYSSSPENCTGFEQTVSVDDTKPYRNTAPTIDNRKKDIDSETKTARTLTQYFYRQYESKTKEPFVARWETDTKRFADLLTTFDYDKITTLIDTYFKSTDKFVVDNNYTCAVFFSQIEKLNKRNTDGGELVYY